VETETPGRFGVLVPLDGSTLARQAIPYAVALLAPDAELTLLEVLPDAKATYGVWGELVVSEEEIAATLGDAAAERLAKAAAALPGSVANAQTVVTVGDPAEEIIRVAEERGAGLIVLASHGRGALGRWTFGSVADRVARASTIPVMIIRPQDAPSVPDGAEIDRLIVPLDGSPLAAQALPVAKTLARQLGIPVRLVRAINPATVYRSAPDLAAPMPGQLFEEVTADVAEEAWRSLAAATADLAEAGVAISSELLIGTPFASIVEAALPGDVIVLASHGRGGVVRWLLGSVAEKLVRLGTVPVVVVPTAERNPAVQPAKQRVLAAASVPIS
jgi:nucleotide-binding universal stress UspA family protein